MATATAMIGLVPLMLAASAAAHGAAPLLSLQEASERSGSNYVPKHEGERIRVAGIVQTPALRVVGYWHLPLRDLAGYGLILDGDRDLLGTFRPGDRVEAEGPLRQRAGLPVLAAEKVQVVGKTDPPPPKPVVAGDLFGFRWLGRYIVSEGRVIGTGDNAGGDYLVIGDRDKPVRVFLPRESRGPAAFASLSAGDRVRVRGVLTQYAPIPPYNHSFQVLVTSAGQVELLERAWLVPPQMVLVSLVSMFLAVGVWWHRERRLSGQRRSLLAVNDISERIIAAGSVADIQRMLSEALPGVLECTTGRIYLYRRAKNMLERVPQPNEASPLSVPLDTAAGDPGAGAALCFRNRTRLSVPDTRRSPFFSEAAPGRSLLCVPMFAQNEIAGVLEIVRADHARAFSPEHHAAAQHLANQIAASLRLIEQRSMREQLFRSEKLAAIGQLVSGVASELSEPLEAIGARTAVLVSRGARDIADRDMRMIASEAKRALEIVERLVSFARAEKLEAKPVDLRELVLALAEFRRREWESRGIECRMLTPDAPVWVLGSRAQIERVLLNLFIGVEQALGGVARPALSVRLSLLARRALIEIGYVCGSPPALPNDPADESGPQPVFGFGVCRGIIQSHGGDIRVSEEPGNFARLEVELPVTAEPANGAAKHSSRITALIVEPDAGTQRRLLALLSARGHRVVPAGSSEEAVELAGRFHFDAVFCSALLPGLGWPALAQSLQGKVGSFAIVGAGSEAAFSSGGTQALALAKPVEEADLDRLLITVCGKTSQAAGQSA